FVQRTVSIAFESILPPRMGPHMRRTVAVTILLVAGFAASDALAQGNPVPQAPGRISGTVTTTEGQPLQSVGITVKSATDSAMVTAVLTQPNGKFRIDGLPLGTYTLRVAMLGYKPRSSAVFALTAEKTSFELGAIKLEVAPIELKAVEAVG